MSVVVALLAQLLHIGLMLLAAPLVVGLIRKVKARLLGRIGPPILQPWRDLARLARKQPVLAENASWVFSGAPAVAFTATLAAAALVPSFALGMTGAPLADLLIRLALFLVFFQAGIAKLGDWPGTLALFHTDYQLPLLPPD